MRRQDTDYYPETVSSLPAIDAIVGQSPTAEPLKIETQSRSADQREMSPTSPTSSRGRTRGRLFGSPTRCTSPEARFVCNGWCEYSEEPHPNIVSIRDHLSRSSGTYVCRQLSLSACSDLQRAWEGPKGSLTTVLCNYLSKCMLCNFPISRSDRRHQRSAAAHHTVT